MIEIDTLTHSHGFPTCYILMTILSISIDIVTFPKQRNND